jgi:pyruvate dehydrogenase E2 component (dihydrolipoamide acetyltransferase)
MPALGQTSDELRIVAWLKAVGDEVAEGEPLLEVETDKATLEVEASSPGVVLAIVHEAGTVVTAGDVIGWIGTPGEDVPSEPGAVAAVTSRVLASPATRALAREHKLDLDRIKGSGPGGRIDRDDVLAAVQARAQGGETPAHSDALPAYRQAAAVRLTRAAAVPQFSLAATVDLSRTVANIASTDGLSLTHLLLQAVAAALRLQPSLNSVWVEEGPRLQPIEPIRVGLAVAAGDRLVVPTVVEPDAMPLDRLIDTVRALVDEARSGRISSEHIGPAAVTVSNLGMFGVDWFQAIVDPDQTAVLAAGRIAERPHVTAGGIAAVPLVELVLSVDHRVADGSAAAQFLQTVRSELE